jgi:Protein of unknown function (DUF1559)
VSLIALVLVFQRNGLDEKRQLQCIKNLKILQMAIMTYHDTHGSMPPAYTVDSHGHRMHSWRVLILPFMEQGALCNKIKLDEPWNSTHNKGLLSHRPSVFSCPSSGSGGTHTDYLAVVGKSTVWPGAAPSRMSEWKGHIRDALLLVEYADSDIQWMEPRDLSSDPVGSDDDQGVPVDYHRINKCLFGQGDVLSSSDPRARTFLHRLGRD